MPDHNGEPWPDHDGPFKLCEPCDEEFPGAVTVDNECPKCGGELS